MRFRTTLELGGKTATGFRVPADVVDALGAGKRPPVRVTIGGYTFRSTVAVFGDVFMIGVSAENRAASGLSAGDVVEVDLELDTEPREVTIPADLAAVLERAPEAGRSFERLSYSDRRRVTMSIEGAKTAETRQRRIDKAVAALREGRRP